MSIEFAGSLVNASANNSFARSGGTDADYPARMARLHEESGFDRLLVGHSSSSPDAFTVADTVLNATSRLRTGGHLRSQVVRRIAAACPVRRPGGDPRQAAVDAAGQDADRGL
jgi:hypothetical protein